MFAHVNRAVVRIIGVSGIVTPGRIPVTGIPVIPAAADEQQVGRIVRLPPTLVMPLRMIGSECLILRPTPILRARDLVVLIELRARDDGGLRLRLKVLVLRLDVLNVRNWLRVRRDDVLLIFLNGG